MPPLLTWAQGKVQSSSRRGYFKGKEDRAPAEKNPRASDITWAVGYVPPLLTLPGCFLAFEEVNAG